MLIRSTKIEMVKELLKHLPQEETLLIYSMWDGYINEKVKNGENPVQAYLDIWNLFDNREKIHTSGHANVETLKAVFKTVQPKHGIIPIHTENPDRFKALFPEENIILLQDGDVFTC